MIVLCKTCGERFESLIIDKPIAYKQVLDASVKHIRAKHNAMFDEMSKAIMISVASLTGFMHFSEFMVVPEDEKVMQAILEQQQEIVMAAMGFDPQEDEEEDDKSAMGYNPMDDDDDDKDDEDGLEETETEDDSDVGEIQLPEEVDEAIHITHKVS